MTLDDWRQIAGWLQAADIDCIEIANRDRQLRMVRRPAGYMIEDRAMAHAPGALAPAKAGVRRPPVVAMAHSVGIFLAGHPARSSALAATGARVQQGDVIALLKIGHLLEPVLAPAGGMIGRLLVAGDSLVGYGTGLLEIQSGGT
jgi:acetyl-CoA carboxylase biotin carboxyl carrier protein